MDHRRREGGRSRAGPCHELMMPHGLGGAVVVRRVARRGRGGNDSPERNSNEPAQVQ